MPPPKELSSISSMRPSRNMNDPSIMSFDGVDPQTHFPPKVSEQEYPSHSVNTDQSSVDAQQETKSGNNQSDPKVTKCIIFLHGY